MRNSVTELDPSADSVELTTLSNQQKPLGSLVAAAHRLTRKELKRVGSSVKAEAWQEDAWDMFDLVGEQRFLATTLANRLAQARFFVGRLPEDSTESIKVEATGPAHDVFRTMVGNGSNFGRMVERLGLNLFTPGEGYLLGTPRTYAATASQDAASVATHGITPQGTPAVDEDALGEIDLDDLDWRMLSSSELSVDSTTGEVTVQQGLAKEVLDPDRVILIRVWRPHPRHWWKAESPTRSSLPVLRELVGLTMHISAQVDSRLAGAGVLLVPASAEAAMRASLGPDAEEGSSPFAEALIEAMVTPISDRSSAAAVVPFTVSVPDDTIEKFRHMSFSGPLDSEARSLRDEAIRRLALGQDCPPELLLGVGGMNHWGAWLVREDVVSTHLEPSLALICDAITTQFLHPILEMQGVENYQDFVIWYDVDHMISRPNRSQDALALHTVGAISDAALRDATGFDESSAPEAEPTQPHIQLAMDMLRQAPSLANAPGLPILAEQIRAMLAGEVIPSPEEAVAGVTPQDAEGSTEDPAGPDGGTNEGNLPTTAEAPAETPAEDSLAASAAAVDAALAVEPPLAVEPCRRRKAHGPHEHTRQGETYWCEGIEE